MSCDDVQEAVLPTGHRLLSEHFLLQQSLIHLNHGSFGAVPKIVLDEQHALMLEQERCPEEWFRRTFQPYVHTARQAVASLINADIEDVVLVENASYAVNSVLRSFPFKAGDVVIHFSCDYQMVIDTLQFLKSSAAITVISVPIVYPVVDESQLIDAFQSELDNHSHVTMCIYSHISSMPSMTLPVQQLTAIAKKKQALVVIDGAHAPGVLDLDMRALSGAGADVYTGNCHKWLFAPKGAAFLWVRKSVQSPQFPQPSVISSSMKYDYAGRFEYTGTRDYTPFAAIPVSLSFIDDVLGGLPRMRRYNKQLLAAACKLLLGRWRTCSLIPASMNECMCNIVLPLPVHAQVYADALQTALRSTHGLSVVFGSTVACVAPVEGFRRVFFVRLSAQVYLELSDFEALAEGVARVLKEGAAFYCTATELAL